MLLTVYTESNNIEKMTQGNRERVSAEGYGGYLPLQEHDDTGMNPVHAQKPRNDEAPK